MKRRVSQFFLYTVIDLATDKFHLEVEIVIKPNCSIKNAFFKENQNLFVIV